MKWKLGMIGALAGFGLGVAIVVGVVVVSGGVPGLFEMIVQLVIACVLAAVFGDLCFEAGCIVDLCDRKPTRKTKSETR